MNAFRSLISAVFLLCVAGCASGPTYEELSSTISPPLPLDGRIYFYSATSSYTDFRFAVTVDGEDVGKVKPNSFIYVDRLAGSYEISLPANPERKLSLTLQDSEVKYVRLDVKTGLFGGDVNLVPVDPAIGEQELKSTTYTGQQAVVAR